MRVLNFICENFKRIQVVEIRPNGAVVDIVGKNGAGKSSVLDAVWAALDADTVEAKDELYVPTRHTSHFKTCKTPARFSKK